MAITCPPNCIEGTPLWELYDITDENPEFCLYESIMTEYVDIAGFPVMYYRAKSKMDRLYGEDSNQDFYEPVRTKLYYEPTEETNIIDMFGIRSDETLEYTLIPKATFSRDVVGVITGVPLTLTVTDAGSGYTSKHSVPTILGPSVDPTGEGLRVDITADDNGVLTKVKINSFNKGFDYKEGQSMVIDFGDGNATFTIDTVGVEEAIPMAGDVIKTLWNNRNYEIVDTGAESQIFGAKKLIWEFILRPYRFSEQSLKAEEIHRSAPAWVYIYIYPDGELADVMYPDGTEVTGVPVDTLDIDLDVLECGYKYKRNEDGSIEIIEEIIVTEPDDSEGTHIGQSGEEADLKDGSSRRYGDDSWIEVESDEIDDYGDVDTKIFGY
jgi:hypothetical protein